VPANSAKHERPDQALRKVRISPAARTHIGPLLEVRFFGNGARRVGQFGDLQRKLDAS